MACAISDHVLQPVVLCGGTGSRLWPLSRPDQPKQFLTFGLETSPFQDALDLCARLGERALAPIVSTAAQQRHHVERQAKASERPLGELLLEPIVRNTAAAIALAALRVAEYAPDQMLLLLPSDHRIAGPEGFREAVEAGVGVAANGHLVVLGTEPTGSERGRYYVRRREVQLTDGCYSVDRFVEMPDEVLAHDHPAPGRYLLNTGIMLFRVDSFLIELEDQAPEILAACRAALDSAERRQGVILPALDPLLDAPPVSVECAVLREAHSIAVVPTDLGLRDLGNWETVHRELPRNESGNSVRGDAVLCDCRETMVVGGTRLVAAIGLEGIAIVDTADSLLVAPKDRVQDLTRVVNSLARMGRPEVREMPVVHQSWGRSEPLHSGGRHEVRMLDIEPGAKISMQYCQDRSKHWIVFSGEAEAILDDEIHTLSERESVYIPEGVWHGLRNQGSRPVHVFEIQLVGDAAERDKLADELGEAVDPRSLIRLVVAA